LEAGYIEPKPLIVVDNKPIIEHVIRLFPNITDITFICNEVHKNENLINVLTQIAPNSKIYWVPNENRKGPVDAIRQIFDYIDDDKEVIVSYCDYGTSWDFKKFLDKVRTDDVDGSIPCYIGFHPHMLGSDNYAFCKLDNNGYLEQIKEKEPFTNDKMKEYASNGTYYYKNGGVMKKYFKDLIDRDASINGEYYCSLTYNKMVSDGLKVSVFEIDKMLQWGTPYDLEIYRGWSEYFSNIKHKQPTILNPPNTTLILPMAGKGSRFVDEGYLIPKPLINVNGKPMIIQAVDCLPQSDNNYFICLHDHVKNFNIDSLLMSHYKNCNVLEIKDTTEGQACTCELGIRRFNVDLENPIFISACDNGVYYDTEKYLELVSDETIDIIVWTFRNNQASKNNPNAYAWLDVDSEGFVKHVSCKNFIYDDPLKTHAIIGTMFFRKGQYFIDGLSLNYKKNIKTNGEFYVDDVLNQNIKAGLKVKVFEVKNYICWGTPNDYKTYNYWLEHFNKKIMG